jgi:uncharacterized protein with LGFP repeats
MRGLLLRRAGALVAGLCVLSAGLVAAALPDRVDVAEAANMSLFTPGNIIDDELFYDGSAASATSIQAWLEKRNPNCVAGADGTPCLQDFRQSTTTRPADDRCRGTYTGAANETAATIIAKVGRACGISQKVLLVILQKEQGLVTGSGSGLYARRYQAAMGMGCPDTAACDSLYYGFFNQVYGAARQYKTYQVYPTRYGHRAGAVNQVRFSPDASCGSSAVYIQNQATAGLYNYTPYQPNAAALAAGKGTGDECSAYGNRNFWIYYTDWFGSTHLGSRVIADEYARRGGAGGALGAATSQITCGLAGGGCFQHYANGSLYYSPATGVHAVSGAVYDEWAATGWEWGPLGYPVSEIGTTPDGKARYAHFQRGSIYSAQGLGTHWLGTAIRDAWGGAGWEGGRLGYPTTDQRATPDGRGAFVFFQGGSVYWSPATGARVVFGPVRDTWQATGWEKGPLGFPVSDVAVTPDGVGQYGHFQGGSVYWTRATGGRWLGTAIRDAWAATGWEGGRLGYPTISQRATPDGRGAYAFFQGGSIYWTKETGARVVFGPVRDTWEETGWEKGPLGYPTSDVGSTAGGVGQYGHFQGGSVYWTPATGGRWLGTAIRDAWAGTNWEYGPLGYPTLSQRATPDGRGAYVFFQGGSIYWTRTTGAQVVRGAIRDAWQAAGWEKGDLGYPTTSQQSTPDGVGEYVFFEGGAIYWTQATGAHIVSGPALDAWQAQGWEKGRLGYPTSDAYPVPGGSRTDFQGGYITVDSSGRATVSTS